MKRMIYFASLLALAACGTQNYTPVQHEKEAVNIGYGTMDADQMTTSVSTVAIEDAPVTYNDITDYIKGKVPGVTVVSNPGQEPRIYIRGINSNLSENQPMYILDGTEIPSIGNLNPNDIHSIEVLKDASASIYGVRGGNGVLLITSKGAYYTQMQAEEARQAEKAAAKAERAAAKAAKKAAKGKK